MNKQLNEALARKVLETVDHGLVRGVGLPTPGQMCIEAAVCYAYGLPHSDNPPCVGKSVRAFKIELNDASGWSSPEARAKGMRGIAIAQLGSNIIDQSEFVRRLQKKTIQILIPKIFRLIAGLPALISHQLVLLKVAADCEVQGTTAASAAASAAATSAATFAYASASASATFAYASASAYASATSAAASAAAYASASATFATSAATSATTFATSFATSASASAAARAASATYAAASAAARAASATYAAAYAAAKDEWLTLGADICLDVLKEMNSPGCEFLYLLDN